MSKTQYAYNSIRSGILEGTYGPGHRLVIDQIAKDLGLSIIPVREAIRQLESDGLIQYKPYSGAIVSTINEKEYIETLSVWAVLEGYATSLSAQYLIEADLTRLETLNEQMNEALNDFEFEVFGNLNQEFHRVICDKCQNDYVRDEIQRVANRMDTLRRSAFTFVPQRMRRSIEEHRHIIQLLREKASPSKIEEVVRKHKMNTVRAFQNRQETSEKKTTDISMP
nr:GntR family transcriptional regulator [Aneurinibacillus soli]